MEKLRMIIKEYKVALILYPSLGLFIYSLYNFGELIKGDINFYHILFAIPVFLVIFMTAWAAILLPFFCIYTAMHSDRRT